MVLTEKEITRALTLTLQTHGFRMTPGSHSIEVVYRVYYKVIDTLCPNARMLDTRGQITVFQVNASKSKYMFQRLSSGIKLLCQVYRNYNITNHRKLIENTELASIEKFSDGRIKIKFIPSDRNKEQVRTLFLARTSCSSIPQSELEREHEKIILERIRRTLEQIQQQYYMVEIPRQRVQLLKSEI